MSYAPVRKLRNAVPVANTWLTARQVEILDLYCKGFGRKETADKIGISIKTVDDHICSARLRLGATTVVQAAVLFALSRHPAAKPRGATVASKLS